MKQGFGMGFLRGIAVLGVAAVLLLTGCGGFFSAVTNNPTGGGTSSYVYVTNISGTGSGGTLTAYSLTSGVLKQLSGSPYALTLAPTSVVVAPNNAFLYVGTSQGIFVYTIAADGTLTESNNNTIIYQGPSQAHSLLVDSTSSWLLIANQPTLANPNVVQLDVLAISPTTGIPPSNNAVSTTLASNTIQGMTFSPANDNVFVALGSGGTAAMSFSPKAAVPVGKPLTIALDTGSSAATAVTVDPTSTYLYIAESTSNLLRQIKITNLTQDVATYPTGKGPSAILAEPTGTYVYVTNKTDNSITGFSQSAGALTALTDSPFATAKAAITLAEDSSKTYVLAIGTGNNPNLWVYAYDTASGGTLDVKATTSTTTADPSNSNAIALSH